MELAAGDNTFAVAIEVKSAYSTWEGPGRGCALKPGSNSADRRMAASDRVKSHKHRYTWEIRRCAYQRMPGMKVGAGWLPLSRAAENKREHPTASV